MFSQISRENSQYPTSVLGNGFKNLIAYKRTGVVVKIKYYPQGPKVDY